MTISPIQETSAAESHNLLPAYTHSLMLCQWALTRYTSPCVLYPVPPIRSMHITQSLLSPTMYAGILSYLSGYLHIVKERDAHLQQQQYVTHVSLYTYQLQLTCSLPALSFYTLPGEVISVAHVHLQIYLLLDASLHGLRSLCEVHALAIFI